LKPVTIAPIHTALLILDVQKNNCNDERRPRCVNTVPAIRKLIARARTSSLPVVYSLTTKADPADILEDVAPLASDYIVKSSVDKFFNTDLENYLKQAAIDTVIIVGTAAEGAVLHTAAGAAMREFNIIDSKGYDAHILKHWTNATQTNRALCILYALSGNLDKQGGNVFFPKIPRPKVRDARMLPVMAMLKDYRPAGHMLKKTLPPANRRPVGIRHNWPSVFYPYSPLDFLYFFIDPISDTPSCRLSVRMFFNSMWLNWAFSFPSPQVWPWAV
jgi:hypothetical protein